MTGPRPGGFGDLNDRTYQICAPSDGICDAPAAALNPTNWLSSAPRLLEYYNNPVHAMYNSFQVDPNGTTATQWMAQWAAEKIDAAPTPAPQLSHRRTVDSSQSGVSGVRSRVICSFGPGRVLHGPGASSTVLSRK